MATCASSRYSQEHSAGRGGPVRRADATFTSEPKIRWAFWASLSSDGTSPSTVTRSSTARPSRRCSEAVDAMFKLEPENPLEHLGNMLLEEQDAQHHKG